MLPRVVLRFHSTATVVQRRARRPGWFTGAAAAAGVVGGTWLATSLYDSGGTDEEAPRSTFSSFRQRLASLWGATDPQKQQQQHGNQSLAASALASLKATAARWLAKKAEDPESREALLAFGSGNLLDFLISTATEEVASPEQQHAEQAVVNFLGGYHTASRLLARPGAVPHLLHHIAAGRASPQLTPALQAVLQERAADFSTGPTLDDARQTIQLLQGEPGSTVQGLALQVLTAWAEAGQGQKVKLCSLGVAPVLGQLAMQAVALGDSERELQGTVCRLQQLLLLDSTTVTDADLATWMQPLLYLAADAAAAAAAAAGAAASSSAGATADGRGMLGSSAGAADLALADAAMTTLAAAVAAGGPLVKEALKGLPWLPTLDCLALSPDPAIRARAAAALAALATAGQLESQDAQLRWRDMLLGWLATSTAHLLAAPSSSGSSSDGSSRAAWLWSWFKDEGGAEDGAGPKGAVCETTAANEALARSCVVALRALAQQEGPLGLSVAQLWLSRLLQQLSSRVAAYTSITQLAQAPVQAAAAAAAGGLLPRVSKADAPLGAAPFSTGGGSSDATQSWSADAAGSSTSSWCWWGSSGSPSSNPSAGSGQTERAPPASVAPELGAGTTLPPFVPSGTSTSSSSSWYWPFSTSGAPLEQQQVDATIANDAGREPHSNTATGSTHKQDSSSSSSTAPDALDSEALLESAKASIWRDAAPVTAATAKAAAEELRAAANAVLTAWLGAAGSLQLPSDLMPGMFAPAVVEAYPMAARVVDMSVAQQRTCTVLELLASVVAEDPSKQAWLLSAGILPVLERLALHADASLEPQAFVTKYSSSRDSSRGRGGSEGDSSGNGDAGSSQGLSLSARIGRSFWGWKGSSGTSSSSAENTAEGGAAGGTINGNSGSSTAAASAELSALQRDVLGSCAADQNMPSAPHDSSSSQQAKPVGRNELVQQGARQQPTSLLLLGLLDALDFDSSASVASADSHPAASAAVSAVGSRLANALQSKFTAAALASPRGNSPTADATATPDAQNTAEAGSSRRSHQQHAPSRGSAARLMEFAQGAAGWDQEDLGGTVSRQNGTSNVPRQTGTSNASLAGASGATVPQALADNAAVITAAAEEGASWGDGDGLTLLRLQRQVARILSMLALQPAAAQQLTEAAQKLPGGAAELLQGLQQYAEVSKHLHHALTAAVSAPSRKAAVGTAIAPAGSWSSNNSGPYPTVQDRRKQAVAAAAAAADAHAAVASTAAWLPWLLESAASDDCLLSSFATKALLHLESAVAYSGSRRRQQQQQQTLLQQQPGSSSGDSTSSRSGATWGQRLYQELRSSEELAQFMEGLWPFGTSSSSSDGSSWRPPVYYPDGIHLMHPADGHNWGMLQPPPVSLIDSLSAAAATAASAAAAAAASDLSQSDIQLPDAAAPTLGSEPPSGASVATAALAMANAAAAAAAAAAASVLGADPSQLGSSSSGDGGQGGGSTAGTAGAAARDVGVLQPAVSWLAHKLVKFAEIKEEEAQQAMQEAAGAAQANIGNPAAPLSTFGALQALLGKGGSSGKVSSQAKPPAAVTSQGQQQQQGQQGEVVEEILQPPAPEVDIVFVHGIRGGPFVSWRKGNGPVQGAADGDSAVVAAAMVGGTTSSSSSSSSKRKGLALKPTSAADRHSRHMTQGECWPATWLATDVPNARLLTVEYKAPVTGWEGESLSLPDSGRLLLDKLLAAGIGQRPVVFVCHSMGGLIVKEMLSQSLDEPPSSRKGRLAATTCALAFYATPHFGSGMAALGWKLRHLPGASPAPSIHHLSPGPHLSALNARLAELHQTGRVSVLSLCEGLATNLAGLDFMPRILIVPFESAYPGFGEVHVLQDQDHITVCKPASQEAPAYKLLLEFVRTSIERAAAAEAAAAAQQVQVSADERAAAAAAEAAAASS